MLQTLRTLLQSEFDSRRSKNPNYSLRAFGKFLDVNPGMLSMVLSGKREGTERLIKKVSEKLKLSALEKNSLIEFQKKKKMNLDLSYSTKNDKDFQEISLETFSAMSNWYHWAILSLLDLPNNKFEANWISKRLCITKAEAQCAMDRLVHLGIVSETDGRWKYTGKPLMLNNKESTQATKSFHLQLVQNSTRSLIDDPIDVRDHQSMVMAIDPKVIPLAKEKIIIFKRELTNLLESYGNPSQVYTLLLQLYPISLPEYGDAK